MEICPICGKSFDPEEEEEAFREIITITGSSVHPYTGNYCAECELEVWDDIEGWDDWDDD